MPDTVEEWLEAGSRLHASAVEEYNRELEALGVQQAKVAELLSRANKLGAAIGKPPIAKLPGTSSTHAKTVVPAAPVRGTATRRGPVARPAPLKTIDPNEPRSLDTLAQLEAQLNQGE